MAGLLPNNTENTDFRTTDISYPSLTLGIDFERKKIIGLIDGLNAIRQAVFLILSTPRYEYAIYNFQYGCETESLLGLSAELAQSEIKRSVKEAVLTDDRIKSVQNFVFKQENSNLSDWSLSFDVVTKDELVVGIKYNI